MAPRLLTKKNSEAKMPLPEAVLICMHALGVKIDDVAKNTGVSGATVERVISKHREILDKLKEGLGPVKATRKEQQAKLKQEAAKIAAEKIERLSGKSLDTLEEAVNHDDFNIRLRAGMWLLERTEFQRKIKVEHEHSGQVTQNVVFWKPAFELQRMDNDVLHSHELRQLIAGEIDGEVIGDDDDEEASVQ